MKEEWQPPRAGITCLSWKNTVAPLGRGPVHQLYVPPCLGGLSKEDGDLDFECWGLPCWTPETQFRNWGGRDSHHPVTWWETNWSNFMWD